MRYGRPHDQRKRRAARQPLDDRSAGYTGVMTAEAHRTPEEPLPLPTVKVIIDHLVKVGNMVGELKGDVATKDDIAAVNTRLDTLGRGFTAVVETLKAIGEWIQRADERLEEIEANISGLVSDTADIKTDVGILGEQLLGDSDD